MQKTYYAFYIFLFLLGTLVSCKEPISFIETESHSTATTEEVAFNIDLYFKSFGVEDGLISTDLLNVYNDRQGYTWIATGKGIVQFDGNDFKNYFSDIEAGIHLEGSSHFYEDAEGIFWIFSGNGFLHKYDREKDKLIPYETKLEGGWSTENPIRILEEEDGNLWLGGYGGLQYLNKETGEVALYPISKIRSMDWPNAEKVRFEVMQKDTKGNIWAGTRKFGLVKFNTTSKEYSFLRDLPQYANTTLDDWVTDIIPADSGKFWVGDYNVGLLLFDPIQERIEESIAFDHFSDNRPNIYIRDILKDANYLMLGTERSGLLIYDISQKKVVKHITQKSNLGLTSNMVKKVVLDAKANMWMVGEKLQIGSSSFYGFEKIPFPSNVEKKSVYDLSGSTNGDLLISTPKQTLFYNHLEKVTTAHSYLTPQSSRNYAALITKNGNFYTSDEHRIIQIDPHTNSIKKSYDAQQYIDTVGNKLRRATRFLEDSQGTIWTIDHWGRLKHINGDEIGNVFSLAQDQESKKFINVLCFIDDPEHSRIILGTDFGLATVAYNSYKTNWLQLNSNTQVDLGRSTFSYLYKDLSGNLWSLVEGQLYRLELEAKLASPFTSIADLESVKWIVEEPRGTYWISTNNGILRYILDNGHVTNFENLNFSEGSTFKPSPVVVNQNKIYFGGEDGVTVIDPKRLTINPNAPDLYVTRFTYPYKNAEGEIQDTSLQITSQKVVELDYYQNDLIFHYDGIEYKNPKKNTYSFFLEGYDLDWINVGTQRDAIYTNIAPGSYTFKVNAANSDGVWTAQPVTFSVIINPPWWKTWWAYLIYGLLIIAAIYGWTKFQIYQKTQRFKINEGLRTKISSDLHDEVGTILSGLAMKSELMSYSAPEKDRESLTSISNMSKDAMERMRDTVWAIDSRKDNYENLFDKMKEYAQSNLSLKNIGFQFNAKGLDEGSFISPEKRQNTYLIFKEAIANILKHSDAKSVNINAQMAEKMFKLIIADNGSPKEGYKSSGQGTSNMKMRAERIGGQLEYAYDNGFKVMLQFPLN